MRMRGLGSIPALALLVAACNPRSPTADVAAREPVPRPTEHRLDVETEAREPVPRPTEHRLDAETEAREPVPRPTEHRLDADAERRNKEERLAWFEHMHRAGPGVDWREIERQNGRIEQERRNRLGRSAGALAGAAHWTEVGSKNLAGRMHAAVISPDGQKLYAGSSLGGLWRGNLDGSGWEPLGDNLWGGVHELLVLPPESAGEPDVVVAMTDGGVVHVSRDSGLTWEAPAGIAGLSTIRGVAQLQDASRTILIYGRGPGTAERPTIFASVDYGRTFAVRWQGAQLWDGWMWVPRVGAGAASHVYILELGKLRRSVDGGVTFGLAFPIVWPASRGVLAGSEAGGPNLYAALQVATGWALYRSADGGRTWAFTVPIADFWQSLAASIVNPDLVAYGGVEVFRSTNGGQTFVKMNEWWQYYDDIVNKLHADVPGLHVWPDPANPAEERWYVSTDGGTYVSEDGMATVHNLALEGLAVSQYYSTLSSATNWDRLSAGSQDQGYQNGIVVHASGAGPSTPLAQLISGDYGHLTSSDGSHALVPSTYPGFILVQEGPSSPALHFVDFPAGSLHAWLPPVVADPIAPGTFYFCSDRLWRYDRVSPSSWSSSHHSSQLFGGPGVPGSYLSALAFAPTDPDRAYAVTDAGRLFFSADHGVSWSESTDPAPPQHYFYGNAITVHPADPLEVAVGGSGYSGPGVVRSVDGGATWSDESAGLPPTLVYALVYAEDGSGDLYAGTEMGAWRWDRGTASWENVMGNAAPITIYWSAEVVNDGGTIRFGTYGRGIWDYAIEPGDRDGDGIEDGADACPNDDDAAQADGDGDGPGDACDNCAVTANAGQEDADGDDAGDACDCAVQDATVFAVPGEVQDLRWRSTATLEWASALPTAGSGTVHVVYRGDLAQLPVDALEPCARTEIQAYRLIDDAVPAPGSGFWYLVGASNECGEGVLGSRGSGVPIPPPTCI